MYGSLPGDTRAESRVQSEWPKERTFRQKQQPVHHKGGGWGSCMQFCVTGEVVPRMASPEAGRISQAQNIKVFC